MLFLDIQDIVAIKAIYAKSQPVIIGIIMCWDCMRGIEYALKPAVERLEGVKLWGGGQGCPDSKMGA